MSDDERFDRTLRSWLESGPTKAPDRAIAAALRTIDRTPQQRAWFPRRFPIMQRSYLVAAAVVASSSSPGPGSGWVARACHRVPAGPPHPRRQAHRRR